MAMQWARPCSYIDGAGQCAEYAVKDSRCASHPRRAWQGKQGKQGTYGGRWPQVRKRHLADNPWCAMRPEVLTGSVDGVSQLALSGDVIDSVQCEVIAAEVDHIISMTDGGARLDPGNLQSLCRPHHHAKTAADRIKRRG